MGTEHESEPTRRKIHGSNADWGGNSGILLESRQRDARVGHVTPYRLRELRMRVGGVMRANEKHDAGQCTASYHSGGSTFGLEHDSTK